MAEHRLCPRLEYSEKSIACSSSLCTMPSPHPSRVSTRLQYMEGVMRESRRQVVGLTLVGQAAALLRGLVELIVSIIPGSLASMEYMMEQS